MYDVPFIAVKDGGVYSVGEYFDFEIVNSRTAPSDMNVIWTFDTESITPDEIYGKASRLLTSDDAGKTHTIKAVVTIDGIKQTLVQQITVVE